MTIAQLSAAEFALLRHLLDKLDTTYEAVVADPEEARLVITGSLVGVCGLLNITVAEPYCDACEDWHDPSDGCRAAIELAAIARGQAEYEAKHASAPTQQKPEGWHAPCNSCGAPVGKPCLVYNGAQKGAVAVEPHVGRWLASQAARQ